MGLSRMAVYLLGLVVVVAGVWILLTQTPIAPAVPPSIALVIILLLVGIGVMASARSLNDRRTTSRVVHDAPPTVYESRRTETYPPPPGETETVVEERRYD